MVRYSDLPKMTLRELCELAEQVRIAPSGSKKAGELAARVGAATCYLEDAGVLAQCKWWANIDPEAPPGEQAKVVEFPGPRLVSR